MQPLVQGAAELAGTPPPSPGAWDPPRGRGTLPEGVGPPVPSRECGAAPGVQSRAAGSKVPSGLPGMLQLRICACARPQVPLAFRPWGVAGGAGLSPVQCGERAPVLQTSGSGVAPAVGGRRPRCTGSFSVVAWPGASSSRSLLRTEFPRRGCSKLRDPPSLLALAACRRGAAARRGSAQSRGRQHRGAAAFAPTAASELCPAPRCSPAAYFSRGVGVIPKELCR